MHVHVDLAHRHFEKQRDDRVTVAREQVCIGAAHRPDEETVLYRAAVDEEKLMIGDPAIEGRQSRYATKADALTQRVDADAVRGEVTVSERSDARGLCIGRDRQRAAAIMVERESDIGPRHREPLHHVDAGRIFAARGAQELPPRGDALEQALDTDARAWWHGGGCIVDDFAVVDRARPAFEAGHPAFNGHARNARDRGQGLAAKSHRRHRFDAVVGHFRRGVAFERQRDVVARHAAAVVGHVDAVDAAARQHDRDPRCACINRVFDQFLERRRRSLYDFACGNAVDEMRRQAAY